MSCRNILVLSLALALASSVASAAGDDAGQPAEAPPEPAAEATAAPSAASTVGIQGLRVYRDPVTGRLKPAPPSEALATGLEIEAMSSQSARGLEARTLATGAVAIDLQGRFMSFSAITLDADGKKSIHCVDSLDEASSIAAAAAEETDDE